MAAEPVTRRFRGRLLVGCLGLLFCRSAAVVANDSGPWAAAASSSFVRGVVESYCSDCHGKEVQKGNLDLESVTAAGVAGHPEIWERVVRRIRARQMPPADKNRP